MREFEGYDYPQIAEMTGTTEMNVKVRITRAKKQLRELLAPYYQGESKPATRKHRAKRDADAEMISESELEADTLEADTLEADTLSEDFGPSAAQ
jgi:hypothetical protein